MCHGVKELSGSLTGCHREMFPTLTCRVMYFKAVQVPSARTPSWLSVCASHWVAQVKPGSDPNQSQDCQVEKNIMASDPQALSKQRLHWHAEWSLVTHLCMCTTHTVCTLQENTFSPLTHCHTYCTQTHTHMHLWIKCTGSLDTYVSRWRVTVPSQPHACAPRYGLTRRCSCTRSFMHTLPPEHWMQHTHRLFARLICFPGMLGSRIWMLAFV